MLVPLFYAAVPVVFYIIIFFIGVPLEKLRELGWLFSFQGGGDVPFYIFWTYFDFALVDWKAVSFTIPTQLALTFFGILHVPINGTAAILNTSSCPSSIYQTRS